jgi:hypothetical protein
VRDRRVLVRDRRVLVRYRRARVGVALDCAGDRALLLIERHTVCQRAVGFRREARQVEGFRNRYRIANRSASKPEAIA